MSALTQTAWLERAFQWRESPPSYASPSFRKVPGTLPVFMSSLLLGLIATAVSVRTGWANLLGDSPMHLVMSQRIVNGGDPAAFLTVGNFGTVWLPFAHVALAPFSAIGALYWSGLAGGLLGAICLAVSATCLYRTALALRFGVLPAVAAAAIFATNPTVLYLHTTAMMEPVLLATTSAALSGLAAWITSEKTYSGGELALFAGLPAALAVATRYDGWFFFVAAAAFVGLAARYRWGGWRYGLRMAACFAAPGLAVIAWWFSGNLSAFGDALAFQRGPYSAQTQQRALEAVGLLPTKGSISVTAITYGDAALAAAGAALVVIALIGLVVHCQAKGILAVSTGLMLLACYSIPFYLISLYLGQCVLWDGNNSSQGLFNLRYGAPAVPGLALFAAAAIAGCLRLKSQIVRRVTVGTIALALVGGTAWAALDPVNRVRVLTEASMQAPSPPADAWMKSNYDGGFVLIADIDPVTYRAGIPVKAVIGPHRDDPYQEALKDISASRAQWVYARTDMKGDPIPQAVEMDPTFARNFELAYEDQRTKIYRRVAQ